MSATISNVGIHTVANDPLAICSRMKWWLTSMCFVREERASVLAMDWVLWLSHNIEVVLGCGNCVSERKS